MKWSTVNFAEKLPCQWDELAGENIFLKQCFLKHLEKVNPCLQTYNFLKVDNQFQAIYVDYSLKLDIFTYSFFSLKIPVRIMGIPCSVSKQGFSVLRGFESELWEHFRAKSGAKLILNSSISLPVKGGDTLPTCKLTIQWSSFGEYLESLRSSYRYRIKKAQEKWQNVQVNFIKPDAFDKSLYELYEEVFNNSQAKLEKLNLDFFREISLPSVIIKARVEEETLGFVQLVTNGPELIFLFTGFNHQLNRKFDVYLNLLLEIIQFAIENKFTTLDLGQTSEETKLKLGSQLVRKTMYVSHSTLLLDKLVNKYIKFFSYQVPEYQFHVFK
ncbi:MAG: GNAT family N-acetyltransferase [Peptococcales bacterium]|jgi:hypothetical protein